MTESFYLKILRDDTSFGDYCIAFELYLRWMYIARIRCESWRHESGRNQDPVWLLFWWQNSWSLLFSSQFPVWVWFNIAVVQLLSLVWLCDLMDWSTLDFPVPHHLPELAQTHVHQIGDAISSSVVPSSSCLQSFPASRSFPMSQLFTSDSQSIGASASASVLPMNIQGWFPLELTDFIFLQSKGLSRVFSSTTIRRHQFFGTDKLMQYLLHFSL